MASVVLRFENPFREILDAEIFDADKLKNACAKAYRYLHTTFCTVVRRTRVDDYEYWTAVDIADVDMWKGRNLHE
jgi:hypothetical protein